MVKFKWTGDSGRLLTNGKTYEFDMSNGEHGEFIDDSGYIHKWTKEMMLPSGWVPVDSPSPIRTRREIVPGTYGHVYVKGEMKNHPMGRVCLVGISSTTDALGMTADELREAAHLFNQIAEVLEENAG